LIIAAALFASACGGSLEPQRIRVGVVTDDMQEATFDLKSADARQHSRGQVHPAVVEAMLLDPSLPFVAADRDSSGFRAKLQNVPLRVAGWLGTNRSLVVYGGTSAVFTASQRARLIYVKWGADRHAKSNVVFDFSDTPGAFEPGTRLDVETVRRTMRVAQEREP
jgi:hypothetical protein